MESSRTRVRHGGLKICNNFTGDERCIRARCNNLHVCLCCKQDHAKVRCKEFKNERNPPHCSPKRGKIDDCYPETAQKTCINIPLLENILSTHPDKQSVEYLKVTFNFSELIINSNFNMLQKKSWGQLHLHSNFYM